MTCCELGGVFYILKQETIWLPSGNTQSHIIRISEHNSSLKYVSESILSEKSTESVHQHFLILQFDLSLSSLSNYQTSVPLVFVEAATQMRKYNPQSDK